MSWVKRPWERMRSKFGAGLESGSMKPIARTAWPSLGAAVVVLEADFLHISCARSYVPPRIRGLHWFPIQLNLSSSVHRMTRLS